MRLLHTSDWHLGMSIQGRSYKEDQEYFIEQICRIIEDKKVDAVIIAGDIFDRSVASQDALQLYDKTVTHICKDMGVPVLIAAGNHDGAERISNCNELLSMSGLHIAGVYSSDIVRI